MDHTSGASASGSLSAMKLAELQAVASQMGLRGTSKMRKSDLVSAISAARQGDAASSPARPARTTTPTTDEGGAPAAAERPHTRRRRAASSGTVDASQIVLDLPKATQEAPHTGDAPAQEDTAAQARDRRRGPRNQRQDAPQAGADLDVRAAAAEPGEDTGEQSSHTPPAAHVHDLAQIELPEGDAQDVRAHNRRDRGRRRGRERDRERQGNDRNNRERNNRNDRNDRNDRGERQRERDQDQPLREDDVLAPIAGILDIQDNHAFVRTSGYLPGPNDVYVTLGNVRRWGLRSGDAVLGAVRQPRENERQRQKFNALVRVDSVNGMSIEDAQKRREFGKLTPLYPTEQLRMETTPKAITPRVIDLVAPIGKGQRGLIVSPPKAGKTMVIQQIAKAIEVNNPEVHLMVVLVDERPEEVTDMRSIVKGEVIASTFDRPASDHTLVAELAIERAKRLVELGQDVVVLLDSLTRLSRAYNLAAPASGRILSGGVDAGALYPPKKFFGAARNLQEGGSLTIIASALVETGSKMDEVIFEEFKGTGNMELRLSRQLADRRIFPAIDVNASGTRREEMLFKPEELRIMWKLRRVLGTLDQQSALELVLGKLKETQSNAEFLMVVHKTTPSVD